MKLKIKKHKKINFKKGGIVYDTWYEYIWGLGKVTKELKGKLYVQYYGRLEIYDKAHLEFLRRRK